MKRNSPLLRQVKRLQQHYCDALLLIKVNGFYEAFYQDAPKVAEILKTALITRGEVYITGFPESSLDNYLPKLIRAGHKVAIADQIKQ